MKCLQTCRNMNQLHDACGRGDLEEVTALLSNEECDINAHNTDGESPLHIACDNGHLKMVMVLLRNPKCDLNAKNSHGDTPIHLACERKLLHIIRFLVKSKCSTNIPNEKGETAQNIPLNEDGDCLLHIACQWGDVDIVRYLITDERCNPNVQSSTSENTPLHIAAKYGQDGIVGQLLSYEKCNPNVQNKDGDTPLHITVRHEQEDTIFQLLSCMECDLNVQNKVGDTPLHIAIKENKTNCSPNTDTKTPIAVKQVHDNTIFQLLHCEDCYLNVQNKDGDTPLHVAVKQMQGSTIVRLLYCRECDPNVQNKNSDTPLHIAVRQVQDYMTFQLLSCKESNSSVESREGDTTVHAACYKKSLDIVRFLLEMKCSTIIPNKKGETAQNIPLNEDGDYLLHVACQWGDVDIVSYLIIDEKCNLNVQSSATGNTPLHIAIRHEQENTMVQLVWSKDSELNVQNKEGDTPLHIAVRQSKMSAIFRLLFHQQCNINVQNKEGDTPLHVAVTLSRTAAVSRMLTHQQCNVNVHNKEGNTPLHTAVRLSKQSRTAVVSELLAHQECNINAHNKEGNAPLHVAVRWSKTVAVSELLAHWQCIVNVQNVEGDTPLHVAVRLSRKAAVSQLLAHQQCNVNVQNIDGDTPLHIAVRWSRTAAVSKLLIACQQCNVNVLNKKGDTPLHVAVRSNIKHAISQLLSNKKCNPNIIDKDNGDTPLHIAVRHEQEDTIFQLLSCMECDLNVQNKVGDTPLHIAIKENKTNCSPNTDTAVKQVHDNTIFQLLHCEECYLNVQNKDGDTPLHVAVKQMQGSTIVRLLYCRECDPNVQNINSDTPLHIAVRQVQDYMTFQLLSCKESNSSVESREGDTTVHAACYKKSLDIVRFLLEMRCGTNIPNEKGETAQDIPLNEDGDCLLHVACHWGDVDIVRYLITGERYNLNIQDANMNSPLHIVCYMKSIDIIKLLLEMRCNTIILNKKGETAQDIPLNEDGDCLLHIACQWGDVDIVRYLINDERCNPNVQSSNSANTPLHIAAKNEKKDTIVQLLSYKECNRNVQNKEGDTPLHIACWMRSLNSINILLEGKCSTNIPNEKGETAQNIPLNEDGDCLLHIACQWGDVDIVRYLITDERCNPNVQSSTTANTPLHIAAKNEKKGTIVQLLLYKECNQNVQNNEGDTPLHIACHWQSLGIIKLFLERRCSTNIPNKKGVTAQDIPLNEDGDCLLHIACQWSDVDIVRFLIIDEKCDPNVHSSISENTPLHIAAKNGQNDTILNLLSYKECNSKNKEGDTPLHIAAKYGQDDTMVQLLLYKDCNPKIQNWEGNTPLHIACCRKSLEIIKFLLEMRCSTNIPNKKGETAQDIPLNEDGDCLLHIACQWGDLDIVRYLIMDEKCNPNVQSSISENTPLHTAAKYGQDDTIVQLLSYEKCDPNVQNKDGDTPLHIAVRNNRTLVVSQLLADICCDVNIPNKDHLTPLLLAIKFCDSSVAAALLRHKNCDPTLCNQHGNTPLHLACIGGETQPEMVEVAKQLLRFVKVDPSCVNNAGQTPIELTTNYQLIQAISHIVKCKTKQSVQTYINMFIVGNPETGKSTLVEAICKEATSILWRIVPKRVRRVKNVPLHTAGIIPTTFQSKIFGNTVIYDLAGQVEYYTSHAAVIQSTVISTPPAFIVVVNLSESEEKISQTLRYWWSFIDNHAARSSAPPQVILAGSHADVLKSTGKSIKEKMTRISALLKKLPTTFHFAGQIALDSRDPASSELRHFCSLVNQSCTVLREKADVDLHCHVLYAFLLDRFKGKVACKVSDVATCVKENRELLPQSPSNLIPLISTLSDKGLLLLVKSSESHGDWWIILQKQALLNEINGVIFAPKDFRQYKDLSWSTGVVPSFKLKSEFPDYNPNMVSGFLTHLEFCFKIEDLKTLSLLKEEASIVEDTYPDVSEEYYFFPALVSVENPLDVWEQKDYVCCKCGWFYQCIQQDQFLTTQFLHVLILRLAFTFALKLDPGDCREESLSLCRKCSVWKHGIAWVNRVPIETVVEVGLQYQSVIVMMRCPKGKEAKCAQQCSEVIQKILEAKDEHCKPVEMSESFIHPTNVKHPFTGNNKFYSLTEIARVTVTREENALDQRGRNPIPVQDLLLFDPCNTDSNTELLRELFSEKHSMDETMRSQVLDTLNSKSEVHLLCAHLYKIGYFLHPVATPWPPVESKVTCTGDY